MSNAMRTGKRMLAGFAALALGAGAITIAVATPAQASGLPVVYCSGPSNASGGSAGVPGDPTSVSTDCSTVGGPGVFVNLNLSKLLGASNPNIATGGQANWVGLSTSAGTLASSAPAASAILNTDKDSGWFLGPNTVNAAINLDDTAVRLNVGSVPQTITVTVVTSTAATFAEINNLNTTVQAPIQVTVVSAPSTMQIHPAYKIKANTDDSAAIGLIQVYDAAGIAIPITAAGVSIGQIGSAVNDIDALPGDCGTSATGDDTFTAAANGAGRTLNGGNLLAGTDACAALNANGTGVWLRSVGTQAAGSYTVQAVVSVGGQTYSSSITYGVASPLAGAVTAKFDKERYVPGEAASVTWCASGLTGAPVADGLGWGGGAAFTRPVSLVNNDGIAGLTGGVNLSTYNGCASSSFFAPVTPMVFNLVSTTGSGGAPNTWAAAAQGQSVTTSAVVGSPAPTVPTILIVGDRESGSSVVVVEGTTTNLVGKSVTPFFRFPGQTGFTAGTGTRTVDAEGNFSWQRKTGKQIAVQFRGEGVASNTVIISAK